MTGAKLNRADLARARHADVEESAPVTSVSLQELAAAGEKSGSIRIRFRVAKRKGSEGDEVGIDVAGSRWGARIALPRKLKGGSTAHHSKKVASQAMLQLAERIGRCVVRFETLKVESSKASLTTAKMRNLVIRCISEVFNQQPPPAKLLKTSTAAHREKTKAAAKAERDRARAAIEKKKAEDRRRIAMGFATRVANKVGKVNKLDALLTSIMHRIEAGKVTKAARMLRASRFQLFNDVTPKSIDRRRQKPDRQRPRLRLPDR